MPQHQHFYLACDLSARERDSVPLATIEYTLPYSEYRDPVKWEMRRDYEEARFHLREIDPIPAGAAASAVSIAEQIRSRIFKITRQNQDCTLVVDCAGHPAGELFHHLSARAFLMPVVVIGGSGDVTGEEHTSVGRQSILTPLQDALEKGKLVLSERLRALLGDLDNDAAVATALAYWRACNHQVIKPEPAKESAKVQSGWGQVRLL